MKWVVALACLAGISAVAPAQTPIAPRAAAEVSLPSILTPGTAPDATTQPITSPSIDTVTTMPTGQPVVDLEHATRVVLRASIHTAPAKGDAAVSSRHLRPYRSLACDLGQHASSLPWLNGGFARLGQRIFIPAARGTKLPNDEIHDGLFQCDDHKREVRGNQISVFAPHGILEKHLKALNFHELLARHNGGMITAYVLP